MKESNSFERLVSTISQEERTSLLKKLKTSEKEEELGQLKPITDEKEYTENSIQELLKNENLFTRIYLFIKSLFTSESVEYVYNDMLLKGRAKNIEKNHPTLLNYKEKVFTTGLYNQIYELSLVAHFFKPFINSYEDNRSLFYITLSGIVVPELTKRMDEEANPHNSKMPPEDIISRRSSFAKKIDEIINDISVSEKNTILITIRAIEWLSAFCDLPFNKVLAKFTALSGSEFSLPFENGTKEFALFAKVLSTGTRFPLEMFETFYILQNTKKKIQSQNTTNPESETTAFADTADEEILKDFIEKSSEQIQLIKMYIQTVPVIDIARIAHNNILWQPEALERSEGWLIQLKSYWKKFFDDTWEQWLISVKKNMLLEQIKKLIGEENYPKLPYKPWAKIESIFSFQFEHSLEFIFAFFKTTYPKHAAVLKEVLLNGDFVQRDNKTEFTDTYNALGQIEKSLHLLNEKLSFKGTYGQAFTKLHHEALITVQGQAKLKALLHSVEGEIKTLIVHFADSCRSMTSLIGGILHEEKNLRYASLKNIAEIWGNKNIEFRNQLHETRVDFLDSLEIIKELDSLSLLETSAKN